MTTIHDVADEAVGSFLEYRDQHGYPESTARVSAVREIVEGAEADLPGSPPLLLVQRTETACPSCGLIPGVLVEAELPAVLVMPPEPAVGCVVEIVGGRFDGVRVVRRLSRLEGWQTELSPPTGIEHVWHSWPAVFVLARLDGGDGSVRLVPA